MDDLADMGGPVDFPPPPELPHYIGNLLMAFSYAETATHFVIWRILGVHRDDGRAITGRLSTKPRLQLLDGLCERHMASPGRKEQLLAATKALSLASEYRNLGAHGDWRTKKSGELYCLSIEYPAEEGLWGVKPVTLPELANAASDSHKAKLNLWDVDAWLKVTPRGSW